MNAFRIRENSSGRVQASRNQETTGSTAVEITPPPDSGIRFAIRIAQKWIVTENRNHATQPIWWIVRCSAESIDGKAKKPAKARQVGVSRPTKEGRRCLARASIPSLMVAWSSVGLGSVIVVISCKVGGSAPPDNPMPFNQ